MSSKPQIRLLVATLVLVGPWAVAGMARAEETCEECHAEQRVPFVRDPVQMLERSVHGEVGLHCSDCHGGRPDEPTVRAHDRAAGFRPRFVAETMTSLCGDCHASLDRMSQFDSDLPTDQLSQYQASHHGIMFASSHADSFEAGNPRAASCVTCHGAHNILRVRDVHSSVNPAHVADTCGRCHADPQIGGAAGLPIDQERQWRHSVHGRAHVDWVNKGQPESEDPHPPTCNDCHDDHAMTGRERAGYACASCHQAEWESFEDGPHGAAFERLGFMPCVDCHGSHEVEEVDASIIGIERDTTCRRCHAPGQPEYDAASRMGDMQREAEAEARRAREMMEAVKDEPQPAELPELLEAMERAEHDMRNAVHALDEGRIEETAQAVAQASAHIIAVLPEPDDGSRRHRAILWSLGAGALLLLLAGLYVGARFMNRRRS